MSDLVERVAVAIAETPTDLAVDGYEKVARAAIAAVLDDLAEPTVARRLRLASWILGAEEGVWQAMLAAKRAEIGLDSPQKPQDAPKRHDRSHGPETT